MAPAGKRQAKEGNVNTERRPDISDIVDIGDTGTVDDMVRAQPEAKQRRYEPRLLNKVRTS
jgi:hypothetical protein